MKHCVPSLAQGTAKGNQRAHHRGYRLYEGYKGVDDCGETEIHAGYGERELIIRLE